MAMMNRVWHRGNTVRALTLQQFRGACAVVDAEFNVSRAATHLHTTQSAVSKMIKALEDELGAAIFIRSSVRIIGLTEYGVELIEIARDMLRDVELAIERAQNATTRINGVVRIGASYDYAISSLPAAISAFRLRYPNISVEVKQAESDEVARWVGAGRVHIGIAGRPSHTGSGLITLPTMRVCRVIVVPLGHELLSLKQPSVTELARFPIVAHHEQHSAGVRLRALFRHHGVEPHIVATASNSMLLKAYVVAGVGIAVLLSLAIRPEDQYRLATIDADHLMPSNDGFLMLRQNELLRLYIFDFIEAFSPQWSRRAITTEIERQTASGASEQHMQTFVAS